MVATHAPGDIVLARDGSKWRVIAVERTVVRAEHVDTGVVTHFDREQLTRLGAYPQEQP